MGGRGASSGMSIKGKKYGNEFKSLYKISNIKFVRYNDSLAAKTPQETMTKGRVYVTVNAKDELTSITYYNKDGKREKTIDLNHAHEGKRPHVHYGYNHSENGTTGLSPKEKKLVDFVKEAWYNRNNK